MIQYELNIRDYWRILRKRKWVIIFTTVLVGVFTFSLTPQVKPRYRAESKVKISQKSSVAGLLVKALTWNQGDNIATHSEIITSQTIMGKVAKRLGLVDKNASDSEILESEKNIPVLSNLRSQVAAKQKANTSIIEITVTSDTPEAARSIANTTADVYVEENVIETNRERVETREFIEAQLKESEARLKEAEQSLKDFKHQKQSEISLTDYHLSKIEDERETIGAQLTSLKEQIRQLVMRLRSDGRGYLDWISSDQHDPALQRLNMELIDLQFQKDKLLTKYTERWVDVVDIEKKIKRTIRDIVNELQSTIRSLEDRSRRLDLKLNSFPENDITLARLQRDLESETENHALLKTKYQEALINEAEQIREIKVIEYATDVIQISESKRTVKTMVGIFVGLMLGLFIAFVLETFDTSIAAIEDVESYLGTTVIGVIPHLGIEVDNKLSSRGDTRDSVMESLITQLDDKFPGVEAYRSLRTNIEFVTLKKGGKVFLVTSSTLQEGKTITVANLAISMAKLGKRVLLVESDMRRPRIHRLFGIDKRRGLTDIILGRIEWRDAVKNITDILLGKVGMTEAILKSGIESLHIITCGEILPNPAELLNSQKMLEFIKLARDEFDMVLFDSPPVLPVTDAAILAPQVDGIFLVHKVGKVGRDVLKRAKAHLDNVGADVWGVILNDIKAEISGYYPGFNYYYRYVEDVNEENGGRFGKFMRWSKIFSRNAGGNGRKDLSDKFGRFDSKNESMKKEITRSGVVRREGLETSVCGEKPVQTPKKK